MGTQATALMNTHRGRRYYLFPSGEIVCFAPILLKHSPAWQREKLSISAARRNARSRLVGEACGCIVAWNRL